MDNHQSDEAERRRAKFTTVYTDSVIAPGVLLYRDQLGTIVPESYIADPHQLDEHTRRLVRQELVHQFFPDEAVYQPAPVGIPLVSRF